jgi:hypothetical protein
MKQVDEIALEGTGELDLSVGKVEAHQNHVASAGRHLCTPPGHMPRGTQVKFSHRSVKSGRPARVSGSSQSMETEFSPMKIIGKVRRASD